MARNPKSNTLPMSYDEQLAKEAQAMQQRISAATGDRIRFNGSHSFITPEGDESEELEVVVLDFVSTNLFYDRPYDKDNPAPPACFAIGPEPSNLVPSSNSPDVQSDTCSACPMNQFGSALTGKGKACKNSRLVAVSPLPGDNETMAEMPIWVMAIPPTSLKAFDGYVRGLATRHQSVPIQFLSRIVHDKADQYAAPRITADRPLTKDELAAAMERRAEAQERLTAEPDVSQYEPPKPKATGRARR